MYLDQNIYIKKIIFIYKKKGDRWIDGSCPWLAPLYYGWRTVFLVRYKPSHTDSVNIRRIGTFPQRRRTPARLSLPVHSRTKSRKLWLVNYKLSIVLATTSLGSNRGIVMSFRSGGWQSMHPLQRDSIVSTVWYPRIFSLPPKDNCPAWERSFKLNMESGAREICIESSDEQENKRCYCWCTPYSVRVTRNPQPFTQAPELLAHLLVHAFTGYWLIQMEMFPFTPATGWSFS